MDQLYPRKLSGHLNEKKGIKHIKHKKINSRIILSLENQLGITV